MAWLLGEPYQSPGADGQGRIKPFPYCCYLEVVFECWGRSSSDSAVCRQLVRVACSSDASQASRWASEGSSCLPGSWGCSCFPRCCSVGNCAVRGLVGGPGCPSRVPWLWVLVDPRVRVKLGADELGVGSWRGECPLSRRPGQAGFSFCNHVGSCWGIGLCFGIGAAPSGSLLELLVPLPRQQRLQGALGWGSHRSHCWVCRGGRLELEGVMEGVCSGS